MSNKFWFGLSFFLTGSVFHRLITAETTNNAIYLGIVLAVDVIACFCYSILLDKDLEK